MTNGYVELCASRIPWIGAVPCHWKQTQLRAVFIPKKVQNKGMLEDNLLSLSYGRIVPRNIASFDGLLPQSFETYQIVEGDDLIFRFTDLQNDKRSLRSARVTERGIITSAYLAATPAGINTRYAEYLMRSYDLAKVFYGLGGGVRQSLKFSDVALLPVLLPPQEEQQAIADYLDHETQKIDELITEQRALIETLRERRESVMDALLVKHGVVFPDSFSHSDATVPSGWKTAMLGSVLEQLTNGYVGPTRDILVDDGVRYIQATHIKNDLIDFDRRPFYVSREWHESHARINLRAGDILIVQTGDIGKVAVVPENYGDASCHALQIARVRDSVVDPWYLGAYFSSRFGYSQLKSRATGATHPHLEAGVRSSLVVIPPMSVQKEIAQAVSSQKTGINELISESEDLIALSQERRAALITAAVTGQIDVRTAA